jgi:probable phosphoglycerate mutase
VELILVRHAEPEWVHAGLNVDDPPLTARGADQAERLAERLGGEQFDEIYVSPLLRARQTASPVLRQLANEGTVAGWLAEIRSPIWQGTPAQKAEEAYRELRRRPPADRWAGLPGGEAVHDFVRRIRANASDFLMQRGIEPLPGDLPVWHVKEPGRRILCIAHAGTNSVLVCYLLGLEPTPWEWDRFVMGHASVTRLEALPVGGEHTFSLTRLSDVEHLPADARTR